MLGTRYIFLFFYAAFGARVVIRTNHSRTGGASRASMSKSIIDHMEYGGAEKVEALVAGTEDVSANSKPGELAYLHWVLASLSGEPELIAECKASSWGSCPYEKERDLIPMFVIGGQCPGAKCKEKQAMLYAIPPGHDDKDSVQTIWTWDTVGGDGPPCSESAAYPTKHLNKCGISQNAPTDTFVVSVKANYLKLLDFFTISVVDGAPRFLFQYSEAGEMKNLLLVALIVEEIGWGTVSPISFKGKLVYQESGKGKGMELRNIHIDTSRNDIKFLGDGETRIHEAFVEAKN